MANIASNSSAKLFVVLPNFGDGSSSCARYAISDIVYALAGRIVNTVNGIPGFLR